MGVPPSDPRTGKIPAAIVALARALLLPFFRYDGYLEQAQTMERKEQTAMAYATIRQES
jgi:hypothetical protein